MLKLRHFSSPLTEFSGTPFYMALFPNVSHCQRQNDGRRALGFRMRSHLSHVPAVGVYNLVLLRKHVCGLVRLFTTPSKRAADTSRIAICARIFRSHLTP